MLLCVQERNFSTTILALSIKLVFGYGWKKFLLLLLRPLSLAMHAQLRRWFRGSSRSLLIVEWYRWLESIVKLLIRNHILRDELLVFILLNRYTDISRLVNHFFLKLGVVLRLTVPTKTCPLTWYISSLSLHLIHILNQQLWIVEFYWRGSPLNWILQIREQHLIFLNGIKLLDLLRSFLNYLFFILEHLVWESLLLLSWGYKRSTIYPSSSSVYFIALLIIELDFLFVNLLDIIGWSKTSSLIKYSWVWESALQISSYRILNLLLLLYVMLHQEFLSQFKG